MSEEEFKKHKQQFLPDNDKFTTISLTNETEVVKNVEPEPVKVPEPVNINIAELQSKKKNIEEQLKEINKTIDSIQQLEYCEDGLTHLIKAVLSNNIDLVKELLEKGHNPMTPSKYTSALGSIPIMFAAQKGYTEIFKLLLPISDIFHKNNSGFNTLSYIKNDDIKNFVLEKVLNNDKFCKQFVTDHIFKENYFNSNYKNFKF